MYTRNYCLASIEEGRNEVRDDRKSRREENPIVKSAAKIHPSVRVDDALTTAGK